MQAASSLIASLQDEWDATRWGSMTAPSTTSNSLPTLPLATTGDSGSPGPEPTAALYIKLQISTTPEGTTPMWLVFIPLVNAGPPGPPSFDPCVDQ
ncbi:hypothetical protein VF21_08725 [Pseudogymnoascus sp. 05NY08]|nr:hypothetical protein VF21_08725 [Pseudogymnoascus sp. 05NY08]